MTILFVSLAALPAALCGILWVHFLFVIRTLYAVPHRRPVFPRMQSSDLPGISILVPAFNEGDIIRPLAHSLARVSYPAKKLEVLFLDDSDESESRAITAECCEILKARGIQARVLYRPIRRGWKAGALNDGLDAARHPFIFILDADFTVEPGIFRELIPELLNDRRLGFVQCRWGFRNADLNWLTRAQQTLWHNIIHTEQTYRHRRGFMVNFNGTGALFRRECLSGVNGFDMSMLTEDLDFTVRAKIAGWKGSYRQDIVCDSLLPHTLPIFFTQQFRWAYGLFQTAKKRLWSVLTARISLGTKLSAAVQLVSLGLYPATIVLFTIGVADFWISSNRSILLFVSTVIAVNMGIAGLYWYVVGIALGGASQGGSLKVAVLSGSLAPLTFRALLSALSGAPCKFERTEKRKDVPFEMGVHPFDMVITGIILIFTITAAIHLNPVTVLLLPYVPGSIAAVVAQRSRNIAPVEERRRSRRQDRSSVSARSVELESGGRRLRGRLVESSANGAVVETSGALPVSGAFGVLVDGKDRQPVRVARAKSDPRSGNRLTLEFDIVTLHRRMNSVSAE